MLFTGGLFIRVDDTRCLNYLHHDVGCSHCVSHCPGQALRVEQNRLYLDEAQCLGCGLCFSDCPTEVFSAGQWNEVAIVEDIKRQSAKVTQLFCGYNDSPFRSQEDKDKGAVQIPTCLSSISKCGWYEIGLLTAVELRLEKCHECPMKETLTRMKHAIETAMEWIAASGHACEFSYIYISKTVQKRNKLKAASTGLKVTSRRDLFLSLFKQGKEVARHVLKKEFTSYGIHRERVRAQNCLPGWQKRLEDSFTANFREGGSPAYWPSIVKNANCVNCGLCSDNCPTQALQIKYENGKAMHIFTGGHCLDCRICMLFCPTESITRDRQPNDYPFKPQIILEKDVILCQRCGESTFPSEDNLCYWCRNEPSDSELLSDVWKHLLENNVFKVYPAV